MAQDNGYAFVEVQEDGTKTICIDRSFEAQPVHGMSFDTRPKPDREAMWVQCEMHHFRIRNTTTNRDLAATAGGLVTTGSIIVPEVIDDYMSPQCTDNCEDETEPPATHGTRSSTSKSLTKSLFECDFMTLDSRLQSKKSAMDSSFTLGSTEEADNVKILLSCNGLLLCTGLGRPRHAIGMCSERFNYFSFDHFDSAVYWNDALHWLETKNRDDIGSREFTIYRMMKGCYVWSIRYRVDTDDFMTSLPEGWSIRSTVWSTVLGEMEEDSFLVINLSRKVVQYNLISKTLQEIYDCGSNQLDDNHDDDDDDDDELL
ncbi:hypothetical protein Tco_1541393 [Tanacetum coccineum]